MTIGLLADGLLIVLLGAALVSVYRLNRRMVELREGRAAFEKLTADLATQTNAATAALGAFHGDAETLGKQLDGGAERGRQVIAEVQRVSDDLRLLIGRADAASTRLENAVAKGRREEALLSAAEDRSPDRNPPDRNAPDRNVPGRGQPGAVPAGRAEEPEVSAEAAAFLSSLSGMR